MERFVQPELDVIHMNVEDVLSASPFDPGDNGDNNTPDQEL